MSMMCHRVKIINNDKLSTFRINVTCTTPYNADFDGDEMNMFIPQSIQTQVELAEIADVKKQIISPRNADTIIKLKQDTVIGSYKMTEIKRITLLKIYYVYLKENMHNYTLKQVNLPQHIQF
jgi:DNA-directed RNA polymerase II subunit RPB1